MNAATARKLEPMTTASMEAHKPSLTDRILVVDDEPNICRLLQRYLGRIGYEVQTAGSVPEALETLEASRFDLVLTDLRLPGPSEERGGPLLVHHRRRG